MIHLTFIDGPGPGVGGRFVLSSKSTGGNYCSEVHFPDKNCVESDPGSLVKKDAVVSTLRIIYIYIYVVM